MESFQGLVTCFQGPVTRSRERKIEEETQGNNSRRDGRSYVGFEGYNVNYNYGGYSYRRNTYEGSKYFEKQNVWPFSYNQLKLPLFLGVFDPEEYLDWEGRVEALFYAYGIFEEDKGCPIGEGFMRCEKGSKSRKHQELKNFPETLNFHKLKSKFEESVEVHVEEEMSKEDFGDSISDMSFEEEESIEIERKDRVEEKERLVEKLSFFDSISSLGEKYERDERSKEEENDLKTNERTKEMSEEKREYSKEEFNNFGEPSKNQEGRLGYHSIKTIRFFPSSSYLNQEPVKCFEGQTKPITEEMKNHKRKAKTKPTSDGRLPPYCPRLSSQTRPPSRPDPAGSILQLILVWVELWVGVVEGDQVLLKAKGPMEAADNTDLLVMI
ncbi:hypothetical protein M9H77_02467 [Catharanthus roseus]|uniref:Uncharacterized protein n=1 Tax=Catharanthus roseus TaxID=4058 RepID=A0ACC0C8K8_CATRO|nr:hypothetical protein M9H77_02467 [Catharanthus roseus]